MLPEKRRIRPSPPDEAPSSAQRSSRGAGSPGAPGPLSPQDLFVHGSSAARSFLDELGRVAGSEASVLLEGEHGSGKSLAAEWLHRVSPRAAGPFVEVSIASLAPTLVESELFGHEIGAFTGASNARAGRFRAASGGTLVLDGIEVLAPEVQVKLLRALQERVVEPLGAERSEAIDIRVVATSARDLAAEVEAGRFREDLYFRLAIVTLRVPPLRARAEDLAGLVALLSRRVAERARVAPRPLSPGALERLAAHAWPGNVRELENSLERVMVLAPTDGPREVQATEFDFLAEAVGGGARAVAREALGLGLSLDDFTAALLEEAIAEEGGNLSAAARRVGLSRRAFDYRRKKLAENPPNPPAGTEQDAGS